MEIFAVRWNVISEISKLLLNDIFAELDGSRQWDWEYYDWLDQGGLQVERYISQNYTSQVNQASSRCFFRCFQWEFWEGVSTIFQLSIMMLHVSAAAGFYEFHFKFKA